MRLNEISTEDLKDVDTTSEDNVRDELVRFLMTDTQVTDAEFHSFAERLGLDPERVEEIAYKMLRELLKDVGKHNDVPDAEFNTDELKKGIDIEMEHTNDPYVAKMIAKDHLKELPDYYTRLSNMEREAK